MDELLKILIKPETLTAIIVTVLGVIRVVFVENKFGKKFGTLNKKAHSQSEAINNQQNDLNQLWATINELRADNRRLEVAFINQAESYTKQIEIMKQEHREEIQRLKTFYDSELNRLRIELKTYGRPGTGEIK